MDNESLKNLPEIKNKILSFIRIKGPSLPVHISREIKTSMLFASAFLSELLSERKLTTSNMRVGGSPLYFLPGQENMLENFYNFLPGKEKEAFLLLKEKKVLEDGKMLPAIRVALRSIKDFAKSFSFQGRLLWRYFMLNEEEATNLIKPPEKPEAELKQKIELKLEKKPEKIKEVQEKIETVRKVAKKEKEKAVKEKPLLKLEKPKVRLKKPREKSSFVLQVLEFIKKKDIELLEELEHKKRELTAKVRINSEIGKIEFFSLAKDKKRVTENDLALLLQKAQSMKLPALLIATGKPDKKALEYLETWKNMIKIVELNL